MNCGRAMGASRRDDKGVAMYAKVCKVMVVDDNLRNKENTHVIATRR
jgi:hypothetical protein